MLIETKRQCPISVYELRCSKDSCESCDIREAVITKVNEDKPQNYEPSWQHIKNMLGTKEAE